MTARVDDSCPAPIAAMQGVLTVSIQGALDAALVLRLKSDLAESLFKRTGRGLVLDVSGVEVLDGLNSRTVYDIASVAQLMGVPTVLCGDPLIERTLADMGVEMEGLAIATDLASAYAKLRGAMSPAGQL